MSNDTIILVDVSNTIYKSCYVYSKYQYKGRFTGGIYGLLMQISKVASLHPATRVVFCFDSKPYEKASLLSGYKGGRTSVSEEVVEKYEESLDILDDFIELGFYEYTQRGMEADDLIASIILTMCDIPKFVIMSGDSDMDQVIDFGPNIVFYRGSGNNRKSGRSFDTPADIRFDFEQMYDVPFTRDNFILRGALEGTHNGSVGIESIGPKTMKKLFSDKIQLQRLIDRHKEKIEINKRIASLPWEGAPVLSEENNAKFRNPIKINKMELIRFLKMLGIVYAPYFNRFFGPMFR